MPAKGVKTEEGTIKASLAFLENLLGDYRPRDFAVRLWDGNTWDAEPGRPARFTLVLKHPGALRSMFWPPGEISLAEAYIYDDFDIEGGIEDVFGLADHLLTRRRSPAERLLQARRVLSLPAGRGDGRARTGREAARLRGTRHSKERDRQAVTYHYDVPGEFYALWLDERMVYSCASTTRSRSGTGYAAWRPSPTRRAGSPTRPPTGCGGCTCPARPTAFGRVGSTSTRHCSPNPNAARAGCL